ncbi:hypothetical protein KFE25_008551 [Diacronema lutheri]|uniref:GCVT N-terminal domain-containing protein n=1 Tax=Diacronema lutheri TaxID=2081491 RepID=A0A8J5XYA2_DIALT|nr:hypothetical protein KFE25_008551 [Diacronema lutheri]
MAPSRRRACLAFLASCLPLVALASQAVGSLQPLRQLQVARGARLGAVSYADGEVADDVVVAFGPAHDGDGADLLPALRRALAADCVVLDRSHWRVLRLRGEDRRRFLHSQCTNELAGAPAGALLDACVLDAQGRMVDLLTVADVPSDGELVIVASPNRGARLAAAFERVIFPLDRVECGLEPRGRSALFELIGAGARRRAARALGVVEAELPAANGARVIGDVLALGSGSLSRAHDGACALLAPAARAAALWDALGVREPGAGTGAGEPALGGEREWQALRIACGRPFPDAELTRETNPLELGLYHTISFKKGCYLGQETVAKVNAAPAPKQRLFGVRLDRPLPVGAPLFADGADGSGARAGIVTSMLASGDGLAIIRSAVGSAGLRVRGETDGAGGGSRGQVVELPFASRSEAQSAGPRDTVGGDASAPAAAAADAKALAAAAAAAEAEAARKAAKLAAMQARFDAFKASSSATQGGG